MIGWRKISGCVFHTFLSQTGQWAADQDPHFKNVFYTQLLPELRLRGKTVLGITHDDRYFQLADRIIKLDYPERNTLEAILQPQV